MNETQSESLAAYPAVGKTQEHISGASVMLRAVTDRKAVGEKKTSMNQDSEMVPGLCWGGGKWESEKSTVRTGQEREEQAWRKPEVNGEAGYTVRELPVSILQAAAPALACAS